MNCIFDGVESFKVPIYSDNRGSFQESFRKDLFEKRIGEIDFVQDNQSYSEYGVIRGLHYQIEPFQQSKLIRVVSGRKLNSEDNIHLFIPSGFAHGFSVLSKEALVSYKVDNYYSKDHERGIIYNDSYLNIDWKIPTKDIIISNKDQKLDNFVQCMKFK